jgi:quercetin dioxygenase-like cupin family protein
MTRIAHCCCGSLRAETTGEPALVAACHCMECQRRTGSTFGVGAYFPKEQVPDTDTVLFRTRMAAGKTVPLHSHVDPECFYVLSGRIEVFLVGERPRWHVIEANHSLLIADGVKHAVRTTAHHPADLVLATNNRLARYFREAGRPVMPGAEPVPPTPEDIQRIIRVSEAYGYWIASPAESAAITGD